MKRSEEKWLTKTIRKVVIILCGIISVSLCTISAAACDNENCDGLSLDLTECPQCLYETYSKDTLDYTYDLCKTNGIPYEMVLGIIYNESRFRSKATGTNANGTQDYGLMQINDVCGTFLRDSIEIDSMEDLLQPEINILAGIILLKYHKDYTQDDNLALLRYQVGEGYYDYLINQGIFTTDTHQRVMEYVNTYKLIIKQIKY